MVYYKRAVLASCFALASSISAKEGIPSLKEIINEIPEDNVRVSIETAYMNGNFDEVEKGLFSYLDEYNFDSSAVENVQEVKEKAWSIISEGVEEMRTAADEEEYVEPSPSEEDAGPSPAGEDAGPSPAGEDAGTTEEEIEEMIKDLTELSIFEIVDTMPESEAKTKLVKDICGNDEALSEADVEEVLKAVMPPGVSDTSTNAVKSFLLGKVHKHFDDGGSAEGCEDADAVVPQLMEGKSDVVDALHDIAVTQQKIVDLINELEGGL